MRHDRDPFFGRVPKLVALVAAGGLALGTIGCGNGNEQEPAQALGSSCLKDSVRSHQSTGEALQGNDINEVFRVAQESGVRKKDLQTVGIRETITIEGTRTVILAPEADVPLLNTTDFFNTLCTAADFAATGQSGNYTFPGYGDKPFSVRTEATKKPERAHFFFFNLPFQLPHIYADDSQKKTSVGFITIVGQDEQNTGADSHRFQEAAIVISAFVHSTISSDSYDDLHDLVEIAVGAEEAKNISASDRQKYMDEVSRNSVATAMVAAKQRFPYPDYKLIVSALNQNAFQTKERGPIGQVSEKIYEQFAQNPYKKSTPPPVQLPDSPPITA